MVRIYTPQPGTIPYRAIEHLKTLGPGAELSTMALAEALGHSGAGFHSILKPPLHHGLLVAKKKAAGNVATLFWSLGDGTPLPRPGDHEDDKPLPTKPSAAPDPLMSSPFRMAGGMTMGPEPDNSDIVRTDIPQARFGMFSDGTMLVAKGDHRITLSPDEADELQAFVAGRAQA